jgi:hypothetical protein
MSEIEPNAAGPEPEDEEDDASLERRKEEDAQRYPGHENPKKATEPGSDQES